MGAPSPISREIQVALPPSKLWEALKDPQMLVKASNQAVVSIENVDGDAATVGNTRMVKFNTDLVPYPFIKEELTMIDESTHTIGVSVIEGGLVGTQVSSLKWKLTLKPEGEGSLLLWSLDYEPKVPGTEEVDKFADGFVASIKQVEAYVLSL
ncbi:hypothetical protein SELMODRAFT_424190 [Selaginella moellendorffii]|uniref:Bet v I/Major latex protein domain-containing protein n=1 Tax=Selaginella moellendorffii TaxID=88036 RepID=D8SP38_SELML|nr:phytohormone-binding protein [Selaginella moellendorffii]EFJ13906.1 hypothetical protein SELMODRAFT_424190 [Selaginella moellendorffii]|eukprot:XP_002985031.1 phytohormone-binding protein [Selaginella moellendorffii]